MQKFISLFKNVLLAHSPLHRFEEKGHASLTKCLPSWIDEGKSSFSADFERPLLAPRRGFLMLTPKATMAQYALWCENTLSSFAYPPAFCYQHRLNSLLTRDLLDSGSLTPVLPVC